MIFKVLKKQFMVKPVNGLIQLVGIKIVLMLQLPILLIKVAPDGNQIVLVLVEVVVLACLIALCIIIAMDVMAS